MENDTQLVLRAALKNIDVDGEITNKNSARSWYRLQLHVADKEVAKSTEFKSNSSMLKWQWNVDHEFFFEPSSTMVIVLYRGFKKISRLNVIVGRHEWKVIDLLETDASFNLADEKGIPISIKTKISLSSIPRSDNDNIEKLLEKADADVARLPSTGNESTVSTLASVLKLTKIIMDQFSPVHPILNASWNIVSWLYEASKEADLQDESIRNLAGTLREMLSTASAARDLPKIPNATDVIKDISRQSLQVASLIDEYTKWSRIVRTVKIQIPGDLKSRIDACQKSCADLKVTFSSRLQVGMFIQVGEINAGQQKIGRILEVIKNDELAKEIHKWLSPSDSAENHYQADKKREDGTCDWFFDKERVHQWQASPGFLWVQGKAGSGKTILCSSVINKLFELSQNNPAFGIAYFFFDGRDSQSKLQLHDNLIRSLISQFSRQRGGIPKELDDLYKRCGDHQKPSVNQLQDTLLDILAGFSDAYIVIDALDECTDRKETLKWISRLVTDQKPQNLHIVVTSRPESDIQAVFVGLDPNSIEATANQDIITYLERQMKSKFDNYREDIRKEIEASLRERADGSFRWVALQLAELEKCLSEDEIEKQMNDLPKDLDDIYKRMLKAIDKKYRADTKTFLEWLAFSQRPLTVAEIAEAVTVDFHSEGGPAFNEKRRYPNPRNMLVRCSSLVTESEGMIKLSHFSVKEYLLSDRIEKNFSINKKAAHVKISEISVAYLLQFDSFEPLTEAILDSSPLALYAAKHWIDHTKSGGMGPTLLKLVLQLFRPATAALTNWIRIHDIDHWGRQDLSMDKAKVLSPLYYASLAGLEQVSKHLLETGVDINVQGGSFGNALQAASWGKHGATVKLLLENGADVDAQGGYNGNALQMASANNHESIVKLLLEKGADVDVRGEPVYNTPLQLASGKGHEGIVKVLLEKGADVNAWALYGSAVELAVSNGHEPVVKLLLGKGADVGAYALHVASEKGYEGIVKLVLEKGVDINAHGASYRNALQLALENGHEPVAKLLLEKGADPNVQKEPNALQVASGKGYEAIAKLLLEKGADVNAEGGTDGNALQMASRKGYGAIVKLLLDKGADVNAQGGPYGNALEAASENGHEPVVKLLLEKGADVNVQGGFYGNVLQVASGKGYVAIVKLLLEKGANVNVQEGRLYGNPLQVASENGHEPVVKLLLENGADVNVQRGRYDSALQAASKKGHKAIVKLLLGKGASMNAQGDLNGNKLQAAPDNGHGPIKDSSQRSLLHNTQAMTKFPILIVLLGQAGSGKSSFINAVAGEDIARVGHGLNSETENVMAFEIDYEGHKITLVDTPEFDDSYRRTRGEDLLEEIAKIRRRTAIHGRIFSGVIYTHNINQHITSSSSVYPALFRKICGLKNVTVATTHWDYDDIRTGAARENELATRRGLLKELRDNGAVFERCGRGPVSMEPISFAPLSTPRSIVDRIIDDSRSHGI